MKIVPDTRTIIGHLFPTTWAMDALYHLISFGGECNTGLPKLGAGSFSFRWVGSVPPLAKGGKGGFAYGPSVSPTLLHPTAHVQPQG